VPNLRSPTYGQLWIRSPGVQYLFRAMHSLRGRVREIRRRNDEEVCSSVPSMRGYMRWGRTSGANSAGCCIRWKSGPPCPKLGSGQNRAHRGSHRFR